jgi:uncharacterized repeat protein (TIGR04138 family)
MGDLHKLHHITQTDHRYALDAYIFVLEGIQHTRKKLKVPGHVTGQQLLEGIKDLALERYGVMAKMVFNHWGITETIDFGNIVINMVNEKILSKTPDDKLEDFKDVYKFEDVFVKDYQPEFETRRKKYRSKK